MIDEARSFFRFSAGAGPFLRERLDGPAARRVLKQALQERAQAFLKLMEKAVFGYPRSPYRELLRWAGISLGDVREMTEREGVEATLQKLLDAGVHLTIGEFKGRVPIRRGALELDPRDYTTDNPFLARHFEVASGGSGGFRRRMAIDLALLAHDAATHLLFLEAAGIKNAPFGLWRPVPPGSAGIKRALQNAKCGLAVARWFTQTPWSFAPGAARFHVVVAAALVASRLRGVPIAAPEYTPLDEARKVAAWLAESKQRGAPAHLDTIVSCAIRVVTAAAQGGLDISGTFFRTGGEPLTRERVRVLKDAGCRVACHYSISESGPVGVACTDPAARDDVHLISDKIALVTRPYGQTNAFYLTTLLPATPKTMLNVESGDCGAVEQRRCRCPFGEVGFDTHLSTIRSYEKLSTEGMHFVHEDLLRVLDDVLPAAFGGDPTDYQFVEEEEADGLAQVHLVVHPRLGPLDEERIAATVLDSLGSPNAGTRLMAEHWRRAGTLRVVRKEPYSTPASKVLALHRQTRESTRNQQLPERSPSA